MEPCGDRKSTMIAVFLVMILNQSPCLGRRAECEPPSSRVELMLETGFRPVAYGSHRPRTRP